MEASLNRDGSINVRVGGTKKVAIAAITTTSPIIGRGFIGKISNASNATTGLITVYDSLTASGELIWSGTLAAGQVLDLGFHVSIGLTIVTAGAQAINVSYS